MMPAPERADARANRQRLIEAARAVFRERGLDAEMKEIAERAGVGIGTIYRNFPAKTDLIVAIIGEVVLTIREALAAANGITDPAAALAVAIEHCVTVVERHGDLVMALFRDGGIPPECQAQFDIGHELAPLGAIIRRGIATGVFRADLDPDLTAAAIHGALMPLHSPRLRAGRSSAAIAADLTALFLEGCRAAKDGS